MRFMSVASLLALTLFVAGGPFARAGEFQSEEGISFQYPEDWVAITQLNQGDLLPEILEYLRSNQFDLKSVHVLVLRVTTDEFAENVNLIIIPGQIVASQSVLDQRKANMPVELEKLGVKVSHLSGAIETIANRPALVLTSDVLMPFAEEPLRQRQVLVPGGGKTFVITCTATQASDDKYASTFDEILRSLKLPAPVASGFDGLAYSIGIGMIIGGLIGALVGTKLFAFLKKKLAVKKPIDEVER